MTSDRIIIGAGLYGLYAALFCARRGERVIVLEAGGIRKRQKIYLPIC